MPRKAKSETAEAKSKDNEGKAAATGGVIRIQYYRSFIATPKTHKTIVRSVGLTKSIRSSNGPITPRCAGS
jgi:hypothetical protein